MTNRSRQDAGLCRFFYFFVRPSHTEAIAFYRATGYLQDEMLRYGKRLISDAPAA